MAHKHTANLKLQPRIRFTLEYDGKTVFCSRFARLLEIIDRLQSIKAAAAEIGRSYRHIWSRIKTVEAALGITLVATHIGGKGTQRSELTPVARELLCDYLQLRQEMCTLASASFDHVPQKIPSASSHRSNT